MSLAEAAQASMMTDATKNLYLVNAVINSTVDSLHHEANIAPVTQVNAHKEEDQQELS